MNEVEVFAAFKDLTERVGRGRARLGLQVMKKSWYVSGFILA